MRTGIRLSATVLAEHGDVARARALFDTDPALADDPEALEHAAGGGHRELVALMLRHQPDLARRVTVTRPRAIAELLFERGVDPNRPTWLGITPLHRFAEAGDVASAGLFLDHGADPNVREDEHQSTPLAWAARAGQKRMVELLLQRGAKPVLADDPPWATPRAWAERRGHVEIARRLTQHEQAASVRARST